MTVRSKKEEENIKLLTEKTSKIFSIASIFLRGVAGGLRGSPVASGDLWGSGIASRESLVASRGRRWPRGSGIYLGVINGLVGLQMASGFFLVPKAKHSALLVFF
jgi:hypothetical protein